MVSHAIRAGRFTDGPVSLLLQRFQTWLRGRPQRKLRLAESLGLGEKRFVAVVQFERLRYLVGGTGSSITLLSQLPDCPQDLSENAGGKAERS